MANETLPNGPNDGNGENGDGGLMTVDIEQELRRSYLGYAVSTLISRALPDVRDGFKPVQRRILYAMRELGVGPGSARVKSAKVVGECFIAGTRVSTPDGLAPIEDLNIGDEVYTQHGIRRVTQTYIMPSQPLLEIELAGGRKNVCTPGQQFKVLAEDDAIVWKAAKELSLGDNILCSTDCPTLETSRSAYSTAVLTRHELQITFRPVVGILQVPAQVTYDIQVEGDHEFIANGMLAHNCMGNYHPHGDQALYGTLVRMAQDFSLRYPLVDGQGNFGCFTGDTRIKLLDGTDKSFADLATLGPDTTFHVYSVDKQGRIVVGEGRNARITRRKAHIIELTLDNGEKIRCTPDHRFLLHNGQYKQAQHLTPKDSLMPGYFDTAPIKDGLNDYLRIKQPATDQYEFVHHLADEYNERKGRTREFHGPYVRHHKNFNRWDNSPDNLERMEFLEHLHLHAEQIGSLWEDDSFRQAQREGVQRYYENHPEVLDERRQRFARQNQDETFRRENGPRVRMSLKQRYEQDTEARAAISERMKALWQDPEYRAKMSVALSNLEKREITPDEKARIAQIISEKSRAMWADDCKREQIIAAIVRALASDEVRAKISAGVKALWQDPEYRAKYSDDHFSRMANTLWEDPATRELHRDKIARQWQDETFRTAQSDGVRQGNARRLRENPQMMTELAARAAQTLTQRWTDPEYKRRVIRQRVLKYVSSLRAEYGDNVTPQTYIECRNANWIPNLHKALQYFDSFEEMVQAARDYNHRIASIVWLEETADVYDITVDEHHNFLLASGVFVHNSVDGDPPAAMRYTECRLTPLAMEMMEDIDRDTVDWRPNYDQSRREPIVLPGKFPNFLCNGGEGIAVGMSTSVPPHNLREIVDACVYALDHPEATPDDLLKFLPGPDFPTAGMILGTKGIKEAYRTGRGRVIMQGQVQIEPMDNGKNAIVITELPYQVNKSRLIEYIADLVRHKKVEGITDLADYSDKHGMRIVIELRRDVMPRRIVNFLLKHTALRSTFGVIMLALVNGQPRLLNLAQVLHLYLAHRKEIVVRRTRYELARAKAAAHIREGYQIALNFLDEIIALIRSAPSGEVARTQMVERFGLTQIQAEAILNMQLRQIAQLERQRIEDEYKNLLKQIAFFEDILVTPARVVRIIKDELKGLKDKYGDDRRTRILLTEADEISEEDLIPEEETLVTISRDGYIKRVPLDTYRTQKRGGRGIQAANLKEEDQLAHLFVATTTHYILFFTDRGRVYRLKAYEVPQTSRQARGQHINNFVQLESGDKVTAILPIKDLGADGFLLMATENGEVKRTTLSEFANLRVNGKKCFDIEEGDNLNWVRYTDGSQEVIMITRNGKSIRFKEGDVPERGYTAGGVRGIELRDPKTKQVIDKVVAMDVVSPTSQLLVASERGYGKRTDLASYRAQGRGGKGIITMNVTSRTGPIVDAAVVEPGDMLMVLTESGVAIRMDIKFIRSTGRSAQGVKLINLGEGDRVATIERLITTEEAEEAANIAAAAKEQEANAATAKETPANGSAAAGKANGNGKAKSNPNGDKGKDGKK